MLLCLAVFGFVGALVLVRPLHYIQDDSLFYAVIAQNVAETGKSSFNGVLPTNGYHPLWAWTAAGLAWLARGKSATLGLGTLFHLGATVGALLLLSWLAELLAPRSRPLALAVGGLLFLATGVLFWSEAAVNLLSVAACLSLWVRWRERLDPGRVLALGGLLGLCVLARLDNVFFAGAFLLVAIRRVPGRRGAFLLIVALLSLPALYLAWNLATFGDPIPISGRLKSTFPELSPRLHALGLYGGLSVLAAAAGIPAAMRRERRPEHDAVLILGLGALFGAAYVVLFTRATTWWAWYYVSGLALTTLLVPWALTAANRRLAGRLARAGDALVALCLLATVGLSLAKFEGLRARDAPLVAFGMMETSSARAHAGSREQMIERLSRLLPADSPRRVLVQDHPGILQYESGHTIFPVDGLMTNHRHLQSLSARGAASVYMDLGVEYYLGLLPGGGERRRLRLVEVRSEADRVRVDLFHPSSGADLGSLDLRSESLVGRIPVLGQSWGLWRLAPSSWQSAARE